MKKSYMCSRIWLSVFMIAFATLSNGQSDGNNGTSPINQTKAEKIDELISKYADYGKFTGTVQPISGISN